MDAKDGFQKYLDAGVAFTNLTRAKAEELVAELVQSGAFQSGDAKARVDELLERSRRAREAFTAQVRKEVAHQLESVGITSLEDLAQQVASLIARSADAGRAATSGTKAGAKKAAREEGGAEEGRGEEGRAEEGRGEEGRAEEGGAEEGRGQEGSGEPGRGGCGGDGPSPRGRHRTGSSD